MGDGGDRGMLPWQEACITPTIAPLLFAYLKATTVVRRCAMSEHQLALGAVSRELVIIACPECGTPAEVEWFTRLASTAGLVEHLKIRCVQRHWFLMPADWPS
jgi:hypothetical protein